MVNRCVNPGCGKPLHYLQEGRIFVFDLPDANTPVSVPSGRRLQYFWLCADCSETMVMEQTSELQVRVAVKTGKTQGETLDVLSASLAL
jgi:hypothetical protein